MNALNCEDAAQVHQLIGDWADHLGVRDATKPGAYQELISELVKTSQTERPTQKPVGTNDPAADAPGALATDEQSEISPEEIELLRLFSQATKSIPQGTLTEYATQNLKLHRLKADQLLDRLVKRDLLNHIVRMGMPRSYRLTSAGRDYLIEHKLI